MINSAVITIIIYIIMISAILPSFLSNQFTWQNLIKKRKVGERRRRRMGSKGIQFASFHSEFEDEEEKFLQKKEVAEEEKSTTDYRSEIRNIERQLDVLIPQYNEHVFKTSDSPSPSSLATEIECLLSTVFSLNIY